MDTFNNLVAKDVRGECTAGERAVLESNIREWLDELNILARDVEIQLAAQKARMTAKQAELLEVGSAIEWLEYKAEEENWTVKSLRFKASVERSIREVKTLRAQTNNVLVGS